MKKYYYTISAFCFLFFSLTVNAQNTKQSKQEAVSIIERTIRQAGIVNAKEKFNQMKSDTLHFAFNEEDLDDLGYTLLAGKSINEAVAVFEMGADLFPESGNSYSSLADAYLFAGEKVKAEANYKLALTKGAYGAKRINYRLENLDAVFKTTQAAVNNLSKPGKQTRLKGNYLGQPFPGKEPRLFAPGLVSMIGWSFWCTFSPDGKEFYFSRGNKKKIIMVSRLENNEWTTPSPASFTSGQFSNEPHITLDNKRIFFGMGEGIFTAERNKSGWSKPKFVSPGMHVTSSKDGQIYFTDVREASKGIMTIAKTEFNEGKFQNLERLQGGVEKARVELKRLAHPCIAPDGSYLIFDNGRGMLHISFRNASGEWGEAIDLTKHGIDPAASGATLSPDGKYIFLDIYNDLHWMSTNFIEELRLKK